MNTLHAIARATARLIDALISRITGRDTLRELREINESLRRIADSAAAVASCAADGSLGKKYLRTGGKHDY